MRFWNTAGLILALGLATVLTMSAGCNSRAGSGRQNYPRVEIVTSAGTIQAELWPDKAPETVENFLQYVDDGFYDGTIFHRCMRGFMIQGGGLTERWQEKPGRPPIRNEADSGLRNVKGTLAMARKTDDPHSATCEFFINTVNNARLDHFDKTGGGWGYCVFGQVISGMNVVEAIELAATVGPEEKGTPAHPVVIKTIRRLGGAKPAPVPDKTKID